MEQKAPVQKKKWSKSFEGMLLYLIYDTSPGVLPTAPNLAVANVYRSPRNYLPFSSFSGFRNIPNSNNNG